MLLFDQMFRRSFMLTMPWMIGITLCMNIVIFVIFCCKKDISSFFWVTNAERNWVTKIGCSKYLFLSLGALLFVVLFIVGAVWKPVALDYVGWNHISPNQECVLIGGSFFPLFFFCLGWHVCKCDRFCCSVDESIESRDNESNEPLIPWFLRWFQKYVNMDWAIMYKVS